MKKKAEHPLVREQGRDKCLPYLLDKLQMNEPIIQMIVLIYQSLQNKCSKTQAIWKC